MYRFNEKAKWLKEYSKIKDFIRKPRKQNNHQQCDLTTSSVGICVYTLVN